MQLRGFKAAVLVPVQRQEDLIGRRRARAWASGRRAPPTGGTIGRLGETSPGRAGSLSSPERPFSPGGCTFTSLETHPGRRSAVLGAGDPAFPRAVLSLWSAPGSPKMLAEKRIVSVL